MEDLDQQIAALQKEYSQAVYRESALREAAFLPITLDIAGVTVKPLTPRMFIVLDFLQSPFVTAKNELDAGDIANFLWVVSSEYEINNPTKKEEFLQKIVAEVDVETCIKDISIYVQEAFIDAPSIPVITDKSPHQKQNNIPFFAWVVNYIDVLAHEYGWDDEKILDMPFNRLFQYLKAIEVRNTLCAGKEPKLFNNLSDKTKNALKKLFTQKQKVEPPKEQ
jgi:hypothetical protein